MGRVIDLASFREANESKLTKTMSVGIRPVPAPSASASWDKDDETTSSLPTPSLLVNEQGDIELCFFTERGQPAKVVLSCEQAHRLGSLLMTTASQQQEPARSKSLSKEELGQLVEFVAKQHHLPRGQASMAMLTSSKRVREAFGHLWSILAGEAASPIDFDARYTYEELAGVWQCDLDVVESCVQDYRISIGRR